MNRSGHANRVTVSVTQRKTPVRDAFHARLRVVTEGAGRTQGWLAARFNERTGEAITSATVGRWINGHREPTLDDIAGLASVLGVPAAWLAFGGATQGEEFIPEPPTAVDPDNGE
jgi:transcriptional regulator with XRE-family HTH domain